MTVGTPEAVLSGLTASDAGLRLHAIRTLKNSIIGNKRQKLAFLQLGAVQLLLDVLAHEADVALLCQAGQAVGSFAASPDGALAIIQHGGIPHLLKALRSGDTKVVEAAIRSLKLVYKSPEAPLTTVFSMAGALPRLVSLLSFSGNILPESAASILASCCAAGHQTELVQAGVVVPFVALLRSAQRAKQEAALDALAALTDSPVAVAAVVECGDVEDLLLGFVKQHSAPQLRFTACACLANLRQHLPAAQRELGIGDVIAAATLPVLVRLLADPAVGPRVPSALSRLVQDDSDLQRAAADADAIPRLADLLRTATTPPPPAQQRAAALHALAVLCADHEEHRRQLVDCGALPLVAAALTDPAGPEVHTAACAAMHALSRSTRLLRGNLGTVGDVVSPLLELSRQENVQVAAQAAAALANMALEYSAVKEQLLAGAGVARFAALARSAHPSLRLHGVWGLSSVAYMTTWRIKAAILELLPWDTAAKLLLEDPVGGVREKTMLLLRNLVYNSPGDVDSVINWSGMQLLSAVRTAWDGATGASAALKQHALYVVVNAASGTAEHKAAVMAAGWPAALVEAFTDPRERVREGAVWAVINLGWRRDAADGGVEDRLAALLALGVDTRLEALRTDSCAAVRERAVTALEQFRPAGGGGDGHTELAINRVTPEFMVGAVPAERDYGAEEDARYFDDFDEEEEEEEEEPEPGMTTEGDSEGNDDMLEH